jgi:septum formation protein
VIILASGSPRRHTLLEMLDIPHEVVSARIDETPEPGELPESLAVRLARLKATAVAAEHPDRIVLAADTLVVVDERILGKPVDVRDARRMLALLSGRAHRVITAVAVVRDGTVHERCDVTRVWFRSLSEETIHAYVDSGEPMDKAGGYGLQGFGAVLVERIDGDYFSVIGLPLRIVVELLAAVGAPYRFTR